MKKTDKDILDMLGTEFEKNAEEIEIPLKLRKESIVKMLKENQQANEEKDFSAETGKTNKIVVLRRLTNVAAALIVVVVAALFMRMGGVKVITTDTFYEAYGVEPVKIAKNYEEVENAVFEILGNKKNTIVNSQPDSTKADTTDQSSTPGIIDRLIENYNKPEENIAYSANVEKASVNQGVVTYGEFTADIVKTDGKYLYIVTTSVNKETGSALEQINIFLATPAKEMKLVSTVVLSERTSADPVEECFEIYLKDNRLIALSSSCVQSKDGTVVNESISTIARYYDISDPSAPVALREHRQEGGYVSSGFYANKLSLVTQVNISSDAAEDGSSVIPSFSVDGETTKLTAGELFLAVNDPEASFLFMTVTDVADMNKPVGRLAILGSGKDVYCFRNTVAVARGFVSVEADSNGEHSSLTEIYRFDISGSEIAFTGSYVVKGSLTGGISADADGNNLRLLTCGAGENNLYVLNEKMEFVSGLTGFLSGKEIKSVKYIGNNAYFVAVDESEKTFIVDISDPSKPKAAGKISTEGFSQELYAVSDTALLAISNGEDGSISMVLFDVSNPASPEAVSTYVMEGSFDLPSELDGRCILLDSEKMLFGIPVIKADDETKDEVSSYILFSVSDGEIKLIGTYDHDTAFTGDAAVRGVRIDGTLYTVSGQKIVAFDIEGKTPVSSQTIR